MEVYEVYSSEFDKLLISHRAKLLDEVDGSVLDINYEKWLGANQANHWIVEFNAEIIASCSVTRLPWAQSSNPGTNSAFIYSLYVDKKYRKLGAATKLLGAVRLWARYNKLDYIVLLESPIAGNLYRKNGYKSVPRLLLLRFLLIGLWLVLTGKLVYQNCGRTSRNDG